MMIRRARGYAPAVICNLPAGRPILALGSDLKNTITLVVAGQAIVSQHIGDLDDFDTQLAFHETATDLLAMYDLRLDDVTVAHDLHPQFKSTQFAMGVAAAQRVAVQHHRAHIASVLAEHDLLDEAVIGVAFDGFGYGDDGNIWGGEFFVGSIPTGFDCCASLRPVRMPGGDAAAHFPVQAAAGFLAELADLPDMCGPPFCFPNRFNCAGIGRQERAHASCRPQLDVCSTRSLRYWALLARARSKAKRRSGWSIWPRSVRHSRPIIFLYSTIARCSSRS